MFSEMPHRAVRQLYPEESEKRAASIFRVDKQVERGDCSADVERWGTGTGNTFVGTI
jgi:hypothetical protein